MTENGTFSIRVVTTLEELERRSDQWNGLLQETVADNIFLSWEWLHTWSKHYVGQHQLWIIFVYRGRDQLVGIAPLYIRKTRRYGGLTLREMRFLGSEEVCSSYLDFIASEKNKKAVLHQIYLHLYEEIRGEWDILTLPEIPAESSSIDYWQGLVGEAGKVVEIVGTTSCPVIELPECLEDFLGDISGNERYNLQRKRKRLEKGGDVVYARASSLEDVEKDMDAFINLHRIRWDQNGDGGAFQSQRFLGFHRDISQTFSRKGWVHLDFLLLNGEKVAGIYGYVYKGTYSFYLPAFNPAILPEASPGKLLLFHRIEEAIREGYTRFDLLRGPAEYKLAWANGIRRCLTLRHYNNRVRAAALKVLDSGKEMLKVLLR